MLHRLENVLFSLHGWCIILFPFTHEEYAVSVLFPCCSERTPKVCVRGNRLCVNNNTRNILLYRIRVSSLPYQFMATFQMLHVRVRVLLCALQEVLLFNPPREMTGSGVTLWQITPNWIWTKRGHSAVTQTSARI